MASLQKMLNESGLMFTKQQHVSSMAHVLNLVDQGGLKELGNPSLTLECSEGEDDKECEEYILEVSSQKVFEEILHWLQKLVLVANSTPKKYVNIRNCVRSIKFQTKPFLS